MRDGVVTNPNGRNLVVRTGPPEAGAFSYSLAERICSIGVGTRFQSTEVTHILNREIWYRIQLNPTDIQNGKGCPQRPFAGWIIGKLKTGWAITFKQPGDTLQFIAPLIAPPDSSRAASEEDGEETFDFLFKYPFLIFGTILGVAVVAIERKQSLKLHDWMTGIVGFEMIVLSIANVVFVALLLDAFIERSSETIIGQIFSIFADPLAGFLFLGFVLSVILAKFVSFSRD